MLSKAYLFLYNAVQCAGWSYLMLLLAPTLTTGKHADLYTKVELVLKVFQTAAVLEIAHAALGLVRSSPVLTGFQVFSRVFVTWAVVHVCRAAQLSPGFPMLLFAWSVTEIIRYGFYALNIAGIPAYGVTYLRYTLFIVLYPIGVTGELWCCFVTLPYLAKTGLFSVGMPNALNFTFSSYVMLVLIMLSYIPIFPQLYFYMFAQRRKVIGGEGKAKAN